MSFDILGDLNWLAVIVATVVYWIVGAIWYAPPVFGAAWMRAGGTQIPEGQRPGPETIFMPLIANFAAAVATAMVAFSTGAETLGDGVVLGLVVALGYAVGLMLLGATFDQKPEKGLWFAINSGYHLVGLTIVAVIVTKWT